VRIAMRRGLIILLFVLLVVVSCSSCEPQDGNAKPVNESDIGNVLTKEINTEERQINPSQVIHHTRFKTEPLTNQQFAMLSRSIKNVRLDNKDVWFVRVLYNSRRHLTAKIYFMPDFASNRLRKGKYIYYRLADLALEDLKIGDLKPSEYLEYIQVSLKEEPFTAQVEIPPQNSMLPFSVSESFTDQEVVEIVDFIRSGPKMLSAKPNVTYLPVNVKRNLPIMTIIREGEVIKVRTGTQEHGIAGMGQVLEIRKTDQVYELTEISEWLS
jgi:hypothetical protein